MFLRFSLTLPMLALACLPAQAQQQDSPEALAQLKDGEVARLDLDTIRRFGDSVGRFEVLIGEGDAARPAPQTHVPRRVRYVVKCDDGSIALAAVALYDRAGNVTKTIVVPPGAVDPVKPEKGSEAYKWVQRTCMF
jgi:hypothetical protein